MTASEVVTGVLSRASASWSDGGVLADLSPVPLPRVHPPVQTPRERARVSVVVPCYNYGHYLPACLDSVLAQPGVDVDVTIIDDASPDGSAEVAAALADADDRVRLVRHVENRGHIATYNEGLEAAEGDFVVLLSADDLLTPGALGRAVALMQAEPSVGFVYGHFIDFPGGDPPPPRTRATSWSVWSGPAWIRGMCRTGQNNIASPEVVIRTSLQHEIGGYRKDLPHSGDMEMWMRAASVADVGRINGADQAYYRVHAASMFRTRYGVELADLQGRLQAFEVALHEGPCQQLDDVDELEDLARRSLARRALAHVERVLERGGTAEDPVEPYLEFATDLDPSAPDTRRWTSIRRRMDRDDADPAGPAHQVARRTRDLRTKVRWRVRRRLGM